jgi:hypothetical protein
MKNKKVTPRNWKERFVASVLQAVGTDDPATIGWTLAQQLLGDVQWSTGTDLRRQANYTPS